MGDTLAFSAGYVFLERKSPEVDINLLRDRLLKISGVKLVHALIGDYDLICYLDCGDSRDFRLTLDSGIGALKDQGFLEHYDTKLIFQETGRGYSGVENRSAEEAVWLLCRSKAGDPMQLVNDLVAIEGVKNAHAVIGGPDVIAYVEASSRDVMIDILANHVAQCKTLRKLEVYPVFMKVADTTAYIDENSEVTGRF